MKKMLVMEFNELSPVLMERFIKEGDLPNFRKLRSNSVVMETETDASGEQLNPWVQWVDVHTGLDWQNHNIRQLNAVSGFNENFTWDILSKEFGISNWICGSMNGAYSKSFKGLFLPDPWSTDVKVIGGKQLDTYYGFVSQSVQNHTSKISISPIAFVMSLFKQGVKVSTLFSIFKQIIAEKITGRGKWKRAMLLDRIQLDVFKYHFNNEQPQFSTFFSNAVAHFQHHYWSDFEPEKFGNDGDTVDNDTKNAIREAYKNTDYLVGELLKLVGRDTAVLFVTGLSQDPYLKNQRHYYHINDQSSFYDTFNIPKDTIIKPLMAEQFLLELPDNSRASELMSHLEKFQMDSNDYFHVGTNQLLLVSRDENELLVQCRCTKLVNKEANFFNSDNDKESFNFHDSFYKMDETKTGIHNPVGLYWSKTPSIPPRVVKERIKPSQIHCDILNFFSN